MKSTVRCVLAAVLGMVFVVGCAPTRKVTREKFGSGEELSGNWSAKDAKETSATIIQQCFEGGWLAAYTNEEGRAPAVRVAKVVNKTDEHIDANVFIKELEKAMINSGKVDVLSQRGAELDSVREEQDDSISGRVEDGAGVGGEKGGDFVLTVYMSSILDQVEGEKVKSYKLTAELHNVKSGKKVWMGDHEIQKRVDQAKVTW
jgi:hypothetical protein